MEKASTKKVTLPPQAVLTMLKDIDVIYATKNRGLVRLDLKNDRPSTEEILSVLIGRTGNLRAPSLRHGRTLIVGFDEKMYREVLGK